MALILLSPAKTLSLRPTLPALGTSTPRYCMSTVDVIHSPQSGRFESSALEIVDHIQSLSKAQLKSLLAVSDSLLEENYHLYQEFTTRPSYQVYYKLIQFLSDALSISRHSVE